VICEEDGAGSTGLNSEVTSVEATIPTTSEVAKIVAKDNLSSDTLVEEGGAEGELTSKVSKVVVSVGKVIFHKVSSHSDCLNTV
jgi:hypothetical protein